MEKNIEKKPVGHGGARAGAGRKKGGTNGLTIESLLVAVQSRASGQSYEELLIEDFLQARQENDRAMTHKYHTLISSKLISTLNSVEVDASEDLLESKQAIFAEALRQIATKTQDT